MSLDVAPGPASSGTAGSGTAGSGTAGSGTAGRVGAAASGLSARGRSATVPSVPVPWGTVAAITALVSLADVFVVVSLQGAVGSIERAQGPFALWLEMSALVVPFQTAAVLLALRMARRRVGPSLRTWRTLTVAVALVAAATSVVGIGALAANAARDYQFQAAEADRTASLHAHGPGGTAVRPAVGNDATCTGSCQAKRATREAHVRGMVRATPAIVLANLLVVGWVAAMAGGSLDPSPRRRRAAG